MTPRPGDLAADDHLPIVPFCPFRCPSCNATKPFTYGQRGRLRYHRCQECGTSYRSFELKRAELADWDSAPDGKASAPQNELP